MNLINWWTNRTKIIWQSATEPENVSLTPVMTAPLVQLRDTKRKDSSTALKPMTATGELDSLNTLNTVKQLLAVSLAPRTGSLALQSVIKVPRTPQGRGGTLSPSLYLPPTPTQSSLPPPPHVGDLPTPSLPVSSGASSSYSSRWWPKEAHSSPLYL